MSVWTVLWLLWLLMFFIVEGLALANKEDGDTLSEHVWKWLRPPVGARVWRLRRFALLSFMAWLTVHFLTGGLF